MQAQRNSRSSSPTPTRTRMPSARTDAELITLPQYVMLDPSLAKSLLVASKQPLNEMDDTVLEARFKAWVCPEHRC